RLELCVSRFWPRGRAGTPMSCAAPSPGGGTKGRCCPTRPWGHTWGHEGVLLPSEAVLPHWGAGGRDAASGVAAAGEDIGACGAVLARIIPAGSLEQIRFRGGAAHTLGEAR